MGRPQLPMGHHGKITTTTEHLDPESGAWVAGRPTSKRTPVRYTARCRVRDLDGVTRSVKATADTAGEALRRAQEKVRDRATPGSGDITRTTSMAVLAAAWLAQVEEGGKVEPSTAYVYRGTVTRALLPAMGDLRVWEVNVPVVDRVLGQIQQERGYGTAKAARTCLSQMLSLAVRHGALPGNPVRDASPLRRTKPQKQPRALTPEEERAVVEHLADDPHAVSTGDADLVRFMLGTGCRIGEALALRWQRVDLTPGAEYVSITDTVESVPGLPLRTKERTKSRAGRREVPLSATMVTLLRARRTDSGGELDGPVFPTSTGTVADVRNVTKRITRHLAAAGLADLSSHVLRKTRTTRLMDAGVQHREVADVMGHAKITMTLDTYTGRRMGGRGSAQVE